MSAVTGTPEQSQSGSQVSQNVWRPQDAGAVQGAVNELGNQVLGQNRRGTQIADQSQDSRVNLGTGFQGANLNTEFAGPQFSQGLNATSQNLISSELGNRQAAQARQQQNIQQHFGGGVGRVLSQQSAAQHQLANNPLAFQAFQGQFGQEAQAYGLGQQAQQNTNQARLAQVDSGNQALNFGNAAQLQQQQGNLSALNQAYNQRQGLVGNQQNLLSALGQLAQGQGTTYSQTNSNTAATASPLAEHLKHGGTVGKLAGN